MLRRWTVCLLAATVLLLSHATLAADEARQSEALTSSVIERHCVSCHRKEKFTQLRLGELGWDLVILREKYIHSAKIPLSERPALSGHLASMNPAGTGQHMFEWGILLLGIALTLSLGAWGVTRFLDSFGKGDDI